MQNKKTNLIDESILPNYYNNDHTFAPANIIHLEKLLINMLHEYTIKEIRAALTKLNKKKAV
jgi:hypothetical protein